MRSNSNWHILLLIVHVTINKYNVIVYNKLLATTFYLQISLADSSRHLGLSSLKI